MAITSLPFAAFVGLVLAVYWLLPGRGQNAWLLLASYVFYWLCAPSFLPILLFVTVVTFAVGQRLATGSSHRQVWLWAGIGTILATLVAFRLAFRTDPFAGPFVVLGLSFYALQAMSYLLDLHSGKLKGAAPAADVALYLAYFPKLVAGPIERAYAFLPRLHAAKRLDNDGITGALLLIVVGLTRKLVIADPLAALLPQEVFAAPSRYGGGVVAASLAGFGFVLYNDFAGYTSIVRGVSRLFGIELSPNFAQPLFARSFTEFWTRWHITLSQWTRDYIYLPLSRALLRRNPGLWNVPNLILPPMITMLVSGLWHGARADMLLWGGAHGVFLTVERVLSLWRPAPPIHRRPIWRQVAGAVMVYVLATSAFSWFRMPSGAAFEFWRLVFRGEFGGAPDPRILAFVAPSVWLDWMQYRHGEVTAFAGWPRAARAGLAAAALLLCFLATRTGAGAPFVYQGF